MLIGLLAGSIAALVATVISLPLHSPDDAFFNAASVTLGALIAGVVAGALHGMLPTRRFGMVWAAVGAATIIAIAASEAYLERMIEFGVPLALVIFLTTGVGVAVVARRRVPMLPVASLGSAAVALAVGLALAGQGDAASGRLELPAVPTPAAGIPSTLSPSSPAGTPAAATAATPAGGTFTKPADLKDVTFVVGAGSQSTFTVTEKLANLPAPSDAVMRTSAISGSIFLDGRPSIVKIDLSRLSSDQSRRDNFIRQNLFRGNTDATFTVTALPALPEAYTSGQVVKMAVPGVLTINGADRPMSFEVEARLDGTTLNLVGRTSFVWADLGYRAPNTPTASVQDRVTVEVLLVAPAQA